MSLMETAGKKQLTDDIKVVAAKERLGEDIILAGVAEGTIAIPKNIKRTLKNVCGVGKGLKTKVNANIGTSPDHVDVKEELEKLDYAIKAGADAVMDLSTGGDLRSIRKTILDRCPVALGTVPIYQIVCQADGIKKIEQEQIFDVIEEQAEEGVDFMTVHCGITRETVNVLNRQGRIAGVVSRGGSILAKWITATNKENPLYEQYDRLLAIAKKYEVTLSLGDGLRPGCIADASDGAQIAELSVLGELVLRARKAGVQTMVEGPGHMPLDQIQPHLNLAKRLIHDAPYYLLGPLVTDVAAGYDHITSAIGGAIAASYGADFICYVTPAEHLRLPDKDDVYQGVMAARIAGHAGDIVKNVPGAREWDREFSKCRKALDWEKQQKMAMDPEKFRIERAKLPPQESDVCTMCGKYCAMRDK